MRIFGLRKNIRRWSLIFQTILLFFSKNSIFSETLIFSIVTSNDCDFKMKVSAKMETFGKKIPQITHETFESICSQIFENIFSQIFENIFFHKFSKTFFHKFSKTIFFLQIFENNFFYKFSKTFFHKFSNFF